jgi:DNA polymerase III epsilon subunit family exonuclease
MIYGAGSRGRTTRDAYAGQTVSCHALASSKGTRLRLQERFIAFDVETTGLYPDSDRIVELGAVLFEGGEPTQTLSTLLNPHVPISSAASRVNHITNAMLQAAPSEEEAVASLVDFVGDALEGETVFVAHNARFDMGFLSATLGRLGYGAEISYVDTLKLARSYVRGVANYKQPTLAAHFGVVNRAEHRAATDAETCGLILLRLLDLQERAGR